MISLFRLYIPTQSVADGPIYLCDRCVLIENNWPVELQRLPKHMVSLYVEREPVPEQQVCEGCGLRGERRQH